MAFDTFIKASEFSMTGAVLKLVRHVHVEDLLLVARAQFQISLAALITLDSQGLDRLVPVRAELDLLALEGLFQSAFVVVGEMRQVLQLPYVGTNCVVPFLDV
eukprot:13359399-Heterocapsa_arctica.AAC.1